MPLLGNKIRTGKSVSMDGRSMDLHHWINTLSAWDKLDKKLIAMVGFNVNHNHQILRYSNPHAPFSTMLLPLTSRLVGVGVLSNKLPCSCCSHVPSKV